MERFEVEESDDMFVIRDTQTGELIRANSGDVYEAPVEGAVYTARRLNRMGK